MQFKFQPKSLIHTEVINILVNPRWRPAAILILKISHFWWNFSISVLPRYMQFKFQPKSSIHAKVINISVNPRWRPAAILDFENFSFLMKFSNFCFAKVYAVQISAKKLNPRESYKHFGKSKMAAGRHLGFWKFLISDEIFQFLLCQGICSSNLSQKAQPMRKLLTFWWPPSWILKISHFWWNFPIYVMPRYMQFKL